MKISKFCIYLADLTPRFGTEPGKVRPVVVVQTDLLNDTHLSTIICPITSQMTKESKILRIHLSKTESGLEKDSDVLVDQVRAIDNRRFIKEIGQLTERNKKELLKNLRLIILE